MSRLQKSNENAILFGVLGGIAEYFDIDPVLIRVIFAVLAFSSMGTFVIIYGILTFIMPEEPEEITRNRRKAKTKEQFKNVFKQDSARDIYEAEDVEEIDEDDWSDF